MLDLWPDLSGTGLQEENIPEGNSTSFRLCLGASSTALCWYLRGMRSIMKFILTLMLSVKVLRNLPSNVHGVIHAFNKFICCTSCRKVQESKMVQHSCLSSSLLYFDIFAVLLWSQLLEPKLYIWNQFQEQLKQSQRHHIISGSQIVWRHQLAPCTDLCLWYYHTSMSSSDGQFVGLRPVAVEIIHLNSIITVRIKTLHQNEGYSQVKFY